MIWQRLIPAEFRDLLQYISPVAFKVVDWKTALTSFAVLSKRLLTQEGSTDLKRSLEPYLPAELAWKGGRQTELSKLSDSQRQRLGETVLELYFAQLFCTRGLFLDMRATHFSLRRDVGFAWQPNGLWMSFDETFRSGMILIYEGFYQDDEEKLIEGLMQVGLIVEGAPREQVDEVTDLLHGQFGEGDQRAVQFNLKDFKQSFHDLFSYLRRHDVRLSADFLFLGIYLVTLYWGLERLGGSYDVRRSFLRAHQSAAQADDAVAAD